MGRDQFTDLPPYGEPTVQTEARKIVAALTALPEKFVEYIDDNVAANLPPGTRIKNLLPHGAAYWTRTAAIETEQPDGTRQRFFLKVSHTKVGGDNLRGEFASMTAIHQATPDFVPVPIAVGTYASDTDVHFFLCSFVDMTDEAAEVDTLPAKLAELHMKAVSPNGRYGFTIPTNQGALQQPNPWTDSWEKFFSDMLQRCFDWEQDMHGHDNEMQELFMTIKEKVIPRLLRPLETGGRDILPRIVHGDLWNGNTSTDISTDKAVIFDASSMYAHNEFELGLGICLGIRYIGLTSGLTRNVFQSLGRKKTSRIGSYCIGCDRFNLTSSGCYLNNLRFRDLVIEDMRYLAEKYPNGYEGTEARKAERSEADGEANRTRQ